MQTKFVLGQVQKNLASGVHILTDLPPNTFNFNKELSMTPFLDSGSAVCVFWNAHVTMTTDAIRLVM